MAKKQIRSGYIKSLIEDKERLVSSLEKSTKETLSAFLDEKVNKSLRQMLAESEDDSYEEEVNPDELEFDAEPEDDDSDSEYVNLESGDSSDDKDDDECGTDGCNVWDEIEDYKDSDGEYDLRGKDINSVFRVLQDMELEDSIRFVKSDEDSVTAIPENGDETEFVIDISSDEDTKANEFEADGFGGDKGDDNYDDTKDNDGFDVDTDHDNYDDAKDDDIEGEGDFEFEVSFGDDDNDDDDYKEIDMVNEGKVNLGYTDNYQKKTALSLPSDNGEGDSRFDAGAPTGSSNNKKRWVGTKGANGGNPYSKKVKQPMTEDFDECGTIFEVEINDSGDMDYEVQMDEASARRGYAYQRGSGKTHAGDTNFEGENPYGMRHYSKKGEYKEMNESRFAEIERKANIILSENEQLRDIMAKFKTKLDEAVVINSSLAKATRLFTENSTTREEKINILNRFNRVQTINESRALYEQISAELKNAHSVNNNNLLNKQLTEAKASNRNTIVETNMFDASEELKRILDLQSRMENK